MKKLVLLSLSFLYLFSLDTYQAKSETIPVTEEYSGSIYAKDQIMVATRLMGFVKKISVEEGDVVKKGAFLFEVDPSDIYSMINQARAGVMQAQSALLMAKLAYADAKKDYERFKTLVEKGAVSKRDFEKVELNMKLRKSQIDLAQGMLNQANAALDQAEAQKNYAKVQSPIKGVVIKKMKEVAEMALPGHPVVVLASLDSLQAKAFIKESDIQKIYVGQKASIYIDSLKKEVVATVNAVIPSADPATHSYLVKFTLDSISQLLPGMSAKIKIVLNTMNAIVIPFNTLTSRGGVVGVFVKKSTKAYFKPIKVIKQIGDKIAVDGLQKDEEVIQLPPVSLNDNQVID